MMLSVQQTDSVKKLFREGAPNIPLWKRAIDIACCLIALPFLCLFTGIMAVVLRLFSPGPIFFKQERVGFKGSRFMCYKFRTMTVGADTRNHQAYLDNLLGSRAPMPMVKLDAKGDSRVIRGGWLLRATGIDELPQIINVLRREMSIVAFALVNVGNANPIPINGSINFDGTADVGATTISFPAVAIQATTGDFTAISNNYTAAINSYGLYLTPATSTPPAGNVLWDVTDNAVGGDTYWFDVSTISLEFNGGNTWTWGGTGIFNISGPTGAFLPTDGTWTISSSTNDHGATFSFEASNGTNVPDGGTTALLVGLGLISVAVYGLRARLVRA